MCALYIRSNILLFNKNIIDFEVILTQNKLHLCNTIDLECKKYNNRKKINPNQAKQVKF